jgi:phosphatidylinositol glycan class F
MGGRPKNPLERALVLPAVGTAFGCWFGAIPIALDWNRPWQVGGIVRPHFFRIANSSAQKAWPLPPMFGAILGYLAGWCAAFAISRVEHAGMKTKNS